jgi:putative transposase
MRAKTAISERRAAVLMGISRTVLHYERRRNADNEQLRQKLVCGYPDFRTIRN